MQWITRAPVPGPSIFNELKINFFSYFWGFLLFYNDGGSERNVKKATGGNVLLGYKSGLHNLFFLYQYCTVNSGFFLLPYMVIMRKIHHKSYRWADSASYLVINLFLSEGADWAKKWFSFFFVFFFTFMSVHGIRPIKKQVLKWKYIHGYLNNRLIILISEKKSHNLWKWH